MEEAADTLRSLRELGREAKTITDLWVGKMTTVTRKIRRRLCIVSVKLSGADFGTGAESRDTATLIFPGIQGVTLAMKDDRMLKLGARQNAELKQRLKDSLQGVKRPALVYHRGEWFPAALPELDGAGNLVGAVQGQSLPPAQPESDVRESLNALYYSEEFAIEAELERPSELYDAGGNLLRIPAAILAYAKQHPDGVTAKMCASGKRALREVSADEIRRFFTLLAEARLGVVGTVGGETRFLAK